MIGFFFMFGTEFLWSIICRGRDVRLLETAIILDIFFWIWYIYFKVSIYGSLKKNLFDIGLWVCCIGVVRWDELLPILYVMFVIRLGDRIRRDSGMKLDFVCEFVRKFVCIDLWSFYFDSCIFVSKVIARIRRLGLIRCQYSGQVIFSMVIRTRI